MKIKSKDLINNIGMAIIMLAIITFNLIIGANEKTFRVLPICIFTSLALIILLIKKIAYKENLIKSKLDILVSVFMLTVTLPLVFNTFCTFQGTVEFILKYFFIYVMYLLTRNVVDTSKKVNILIATTIFASLIEIILGFDIQYFHKFNWLIAKLNVQ